MYPYSTQYLATERARYLREQAAAARRLAGGGRPGSRPAAWRAPLGLRRAGMAITGTRVPLAAGSTLACGTNPDLFFAESPQDVARAKELCADCPVRAACLADALARGEPWGVWGGELLLRGSVVPTKRARGRPRKSSLAA